MCVGDSSCERSINGRAIRVETDFNENSPSEYCRDESDLPARVATTRVPLPALPAPSALMIRLLAIDIDGTLLDSHGRLPDAHRDAVVRVVERGIDVALVTGRSFHFTRP